MAQLKPVLLPRLRRRLKCFHARTRVAQLKRLSETARRVVRHGFHARTRVAQLKPERTALTANNSQRFHARTRVAQLKLSDLNKVEKW